MPELIWDGKNVESNVPVRALDFDGDLSCGDGDNLIVRGDNLEAMTSLVRFFRGRVKCIYIDPPYNTGAAFEHYNDNFEHDLWLSTMYPRLKLMKQLLSDDGFFCCELDDSEGHYLKVMCDEVFGRENYLTTIYVQVRYPNKTLKEDMNFHKEIEQIHVYRKSCVATPNLNTTAIDYAKFVYSVVELEPPFKTLELGGKKVELFRADQYQIKKCAASKHGLKEIWATGTILDGNSSGRFFRDYLTGRYAADGYGVLYKVHGIGDDSLSWRYFTGPKRAGATKGKYYQGVPIDKLDAEKTFRRLPIENFYDLAANFGNCRHEGGADFRSGKKPEILLQILLNHFSNAGDLVMDCFLGSGTTAAVAHKLNRRYIGVEIGEHATTHVVPRLRQVVGTHGGGFKFCRLGEEVFDAAGNFNHALTFETLAQFIWFGLTGQVLVDENEFPMLGICDGAAVYLLDDLLTRETFAKLPTYNGRKLIFATACRLSDRFLRDNKIEFRHVPNDLRT